MLIRLHVLIEAAAIAAIGVAAPAAAQPPTAMIPAGTVRGIVHTPFDEIRARAVVTLTGFWGQRAVLLAKDGGFIFPQVPSGAARLVARSIGAVAASATIAVLAHDTIAQDLVLTMARDDGTPSNIVPLLAMEPPLILTHTSAWSPAGEPVTVLYATEVQTKNGICWPAAQIAVHDGMVEWQILGIDSRVCAPAFGRTAAATRTVVAPGRYALLITSGGVTDTLALTVALDRDVIEANGRQRIIQLAQRVSWRAPVRSFVMWCSPERPDGRECEAMRDALAAEPDLLEVPANSPQVSNGYGRGHPLPSVATAYRYVWDAEFDRVREMVREFGSSAPAIAGCSNVRVLNWRGERFEIDPCTRHPGR